VDGALVTGAHAMTVLIARAGGAAPAQFLTTAATGLAAHTGTRLTVVDAVPPLGDDSEGLSPYFMILCVLFSQRGHRIHHGAPVPPAPDRMSDRDTHGHRGGARARRRRRRGRHHRRG
jgi:hypothetical protein